jgi:hypothetical protein
MTSHLRFREYSTRITRLKNLIYAIIQSPFSTKRIYKTIRRITSTHKPFSRTTTISSSTYKLFSRTTTTRKLPTSHIHYTHFSYACHLERLRQLLGSSTDLCHPNSEPVLQIAYKVPYRSDKQVISTFLHSSFTILNIKTKLTCKRASNFITIVATAIPLALGIDAATSD